MLADARASVDLNILAKLFRGLSDPGRLGLLVALRNGPRAAGELANDSGLSPSNASNHLQCLLECGLVEVEPRGRRNVYQLADPALGALLDAGQRVLGSGAGKLIEACFNYGPPSRRALRLLPQAYEGLTPPPARS